jgi:hypothetical protein
MWEETYLSLCVLHVSNHLQISMKFGVESSYEELLGKFHFLLHMILNRALSASSDWTMRVSSGLCPMDSLDWLGDNSQDLTLH